MVMFITSCYSANILIMNILVLHKIYGERVVVFRDQDYPPTELPNPKVVEESKVLRNIISNFPNFDSNQMARSLYLVLAVFFPGAF